MNVSCLIREINGIEEFVSSQKALGADEAELRGAQVATIEMNIGSLKDRHSHDAATLLTNAIKQVQFDASDKKRLGATVRSKLESFTHAAGKAPARCQQTCSSYELYLTADEIDRLSDPDAPWGIKVNITVGIAKRLQIPCSNEHTRARMTEVIFFLNKLGTVHDSAFFYSIRESVVRAGRVAEVQIQPAAP